MSITTLPTVTKAQARKALAERTHAWFTGTTTSNGNGGGTTVVASATIGYGDGFFTSFWLLLTSGANAGEWRRVSDFTDSTGTFTVVNAYGAQVASGVTYELHIFRPDLVTQAWNEAVAKAYPAVYKPVQAWQLATSDVYTYGMPRGMRDIVRVRYDWGASEAAADNFDRDDSTTTAGADYTAVSGTWGISSNKLYSVTDVVTNLLTRDVGVSDFLLQARMEGTLDDATDYRNIWLLFRLDDSSNYLIIELLDGVIYLGKLEGGVVAVLSTGSLTTSDGVEYLVQVAAIGARIQASVDGVLLIDYELTGNDLKFLKYTSFGFRLDKLGSPATAARVDDWRVHRINDLRDVADWQQDAYRRSWTVGTQTSPEALTTDHLFWIDGTAPLTLFSEDSTYGTLDSDSTAKLEIATGTPEWEVLLAYARAAAYGAMAEPNSGSAPENRAEYAAAATRAMQQAEALRGRNGQPKTSRTLKHPAWW